MDINDNIEEYLEILKEYDEENTNSEVWFELRQKSHYIIENIIVYMKQDKFNTFNPLLSLFYAGLMGNSMSTKFLIDERLNSQLNSLSNVILLVTEMPSISNWLLQTTRNNKTLCAKLLELITINMKNASLTKSFFYRDAGLWLIFELSYPNLTDYTSGLLPIALNISDSFLNTLSIQGIMALSHIAKNSFKAHLRYNGQADVIYKTLMSHLYTQDLEVLRIVVPCILQFLEAFDPPPCQSVSLTSELSYKTGYDELLRLILHELHLYSNVDRKVILISHLNTITDLMGTSLIKFSKQYVQSLESTLLAPEARGLNPVAKEMMLKNLVRVLPLIKPIIRFILGDLMKILFAFIDESPQFTPSDGDSPPIVQLTVQIFRVLSRDFPEQVASIYQGVLDAVCNVENFNIFVKNKLAGGD